MERVRVAVCAFQPLACHSSYSSCSSSSPTLLRLRTRWAAWSRAWKKPWRQWTWNRYINQHAILPPPRPREYASRVTPSKTCSDRHKSKNERWDNKERNTLATVAGQWWMACKTVSARGLVSECVASTPFEHYGSLTILKKFFSRTDRKRDGQIRSAIYGDGCARWCRGERNVRRHSLVYARGPD